MRQPHKKSLLAMFLIVLMVQSSIAAAFAQSAASYGRFSDSGITTEDRTWQEGFDFSQEENEEKTAATSGKEDDRDISYEGENPDAGENPDTEGSVDREKPAEDLSQDGENGDEGNGDPDSELASEENSTEGEDLAGSELPPELAEPLREVLLFEAPLPDLLGEIYLDGANGDDEADGTSPENAVATFETAKDRLGSEGIVRVTGLVTIDGDEVWDGEEGKITVIRHKEYAGHLITVPAGASLTLENITVDGNKSEITAAGSLINLEVKSALQVTKGSVLQNNRTTTNGGAIFTAEGRTAANGIAIDIAGKGTAIRDNETTGQGGGIRTNGQYVVLNLSQGAAITGNAAGTTGGGIHAVGEVNIRSGASVANNYAAGTGGGIYHTHASAGITIENNGTVISENRSSSNGGGIYLNGSATVEIKDGAAVTGNTAAVNGGGIYVYSSANVLIYDNAEISYNTAESSSNGGGGMYLAGSSVLRLYDSASIHHNTAYNGGGIRTYHSSKVYVTGGAKMESNIAENNGGAVFIPANGTTVYPQVLQVDDGIFEKNRASSAIYWEAQGYPDMESIYRQYMDDVTLEEPFAKAYNNYDVYFDAYYAEDGIPGDLGHVVYWFTGDGTGTLHYAEFLRSGETVILPAEPIRSGYDFVGWFTDERAVQEFAGVGETISSWTQVWAGWERQGDAYAVTFQWNDGSGAAYEKVYVTKNTPVDRPEDPARDGYLFGGWYRNANCSEDELYNFEEDAAGHLMLYAKWTIAHRVHFYENHNDDKLYLECTVPSGLPLSEPEDPVREGYRFKGWFTDQNCEEGQRYSFDSAVLADLDLFAGWELIGDGSVIYVSGTGSDENNGFSPDMPLRTMEAAIAELETDGTIFVTGPITVSGESTWDLSGKGDGAAIKRHKDYRGYLINVNGGSLILKNTVIDGNKSAFSTWDGSINSAIRVGGGGLLYLGEGTVIQNCVTNVSYSGGAVSITSGADSRSRIVITDGARLTENEYSSSAGTNEGSGGIYGANCDIEISGGAVLENNSTTVSGGAVFLKTNGTLRITGTSQGQQTAITGNYATGDGGGLYVENCEVTISGGVDISDNRASDSGGGMAVTYGSKVAVTDSGTSLYGNTAEEGGGAVYMAGSHLKIENGVKIFDNQAYNHGGGIYAAIGTVEIRGKDTAISDNHALRDSDGGGIYARGTVSVIVEDEAQVAGNSAQGRGGGVYLQNSALLKVLDSAAIVNNRAGYGGGIFTVSDKGEGVLVSDEGTRIANNTADVGGGVYVAGSMAVMDEAQISENQADLGAGIYLQAGSAVVQGEGTFVTDNEALTNGGGIYVCADGVLTVENGASVDGNAAGGKGFSALRSSEEGNGGGIYVASEGTVYLQSGASFSNNTAYGRGGGLYGEKNGHGTISTGAAAIGNTARLNGGGAYSEGNLVLRDNVTIERNSVASHEDSEDYGNGGGLYVQEGYLIIMQGVSIKNNIADDGGGIYIGKAASLVKISGFEIDTETAGIMEESRMVPAVITHNTARNDGGGIYVHELEILEMDNVYFSGNKACMGYLWTEEDDWAILRDVETHRNNVDETTVFTIPFENAYSNYDVNYRIYPAEGVVYRVTYHMNDGDLSEDSQFPYGVYHSDTVESGRESMRPDNPPVRLMDYYFEGWYADPDCGEIFDFTQLDAVEKNYDIYAGWTTDPDKEDPGPDTEEEGGGDGGRGKGNHNREGGSKNDGEEPVIGLSDDHYAYIVGYPNGTVQPEGDITRAEVAAILIRLITDEDREQYWGTENRFTDVTEGQWYNNLISTMANAGVVSGYPDGSFRPDGAITRAELAAITVRFIGNESPASGKIFTDIEGHWAEERIRLAASRGWIAGYQDGSFRPDEPITRAEVATMINRLQNRRPESADDLLPDMIIWPDNPASAWYYLEMQEATNSHHYERKEAGVHEYWTELRMHPDWTQLNKRGASPGWIYRY